MFRHEKKAKRKKKQRFLLAQRRTIQGDIYGPSDCHLTTRLAAQLIA
jgi:hypothetical protein